MKTEAEIARENQANPFPTEVLANLKKAPVRAGTQAPGSHLVFNGKNRRHRRADAAVATAEASKPKSLPKSIWLITDIVTGMQLHTGVPLYRLTIERRIQRDTIVVYSKEGTPPVVGGLLGRMARPGGGEAAIWTDGKASKASIGGGYTFHAVPKEWGFPEPEAVLERKFVNLSPGTAWTGLTPEGDR